MKQIKSKKCARCLGKTAFCEKCMNKETIEVERKNKCEDLYYWGKELKKINKKYDVWVDREKIPKIEIRTRGFVPYDSCSIEKFGEVEDVTMIRFNLFDNVWETEIFDVKGDNFFCRLLGICVQKEQVSKLDFRKNKKAKEIAEYIDTLGKVSGKKVIIEESNDAVSSFKEGGIYTALKIK